MTNLKSIAVVLLKGAELLYREILKDVVEAAINFYFEEAGVSIKKFITPPEAFNSERRQYDAGKLISFLNKQEGLAKFDIVIALIDEDIYYENMNYVFGLAAVKSGRIIISTYRLKFDYSMTRTTTPEVFRERFFKELLHELGHLLNLPHCPNRKCAMSFSSTLMEVDEKLPMLCEHCRGKLGKTK